MLLRQLRVLLPLSLSLAISACGAEVSTPRIEEGDPIEAVRVGDAEPTSPTVPEAAGPDVPGEPEQPTGPVVQPAPEDCLQVRVTSPDGLPLRVRPDPSTAEEALGLLPVGTVADVTGVVEDGEPIEGNARWFQVSAAGLAGFVSGAFASCFDPSQRVPGFFLPLQCGVSSTVTQGNNTDFSHNGASAAFAFDFAMPRGTPVVAVEDGVVIYSIVNSSPGDPCYNGGGSGCSSGVNHVGVQHPDGTVTRYAHLDAPTVGEGALVMRGEQIGLSGTSGWSTGPHLHFVRMQNDCGSPWCQSIATSFVEAGVPVEGDVVTSANCQ